MMTPHAQNLALAKLDGWKPHIEQFSSIKHQGKRWERRGFSVPEYDLPKYTESLDALRPILLSLKKDDNAFYHIAHNIPGFTLTGFQQSRVLLTVSASQLSEAILKAVGKYT